MTTQAPGETVVNKYSSISEPQDQDASLFKKWSKRIQNKLEQD